MLVLFRVVTVVSCAHQWVVNKVAKVADGRPEQELQLLHLQITSFLDQIPHSLLTKYLTKPINFPDYMNAVCQNALQGIRSSRIE